MKANELRRGNLVTDYYYDSFKSIIEIESITNEGINVYASDDNEPYGLHNSILNYDYLLKEVKPIPLTEEWLLKFGFEWCELRNGWTIDASKSNTIVIDGRGNVFIGDDVELDNPLLFVHSLQNLYFCLTQKELNYDVGQIHYT